MTSFQKKLDKILREQQQPTGKVLKEDQDASPTRVHPEKGLSTGGNLEGTGKVDATGPINHTGDSTLKSNPGDTTGGPTGHIPTNSDLPRPQGDGLDKTNDNPGKKAYGLHEEEEDDKGEKVDEGKLPPFLKKKEKGEPDGDEGKGDKGDKDGDEKKEVKEDADEANKKAGFTEEADEKSEDEVKEEKEDEKDDKKAVEEATAMLFNGETISEAFKEKTATIFEAALSVRIGEYRKKLEERYTRKLNERVEEIREQLTEAVNGHLDLVVESWVKENEVHIEKGIKAELVEEFIGGLKSLFEEHYIELPDEKVDVVVEMADRLNQMETKLNEQIATNVNLQKTVKLYERAEVFSKVSKGLAATQVEKLKSLSESIEFKSAKQFETALATLKESVETTQGAAKKTPEKKTLAEQTLEQSPKAGTGSNQMDSIKAAMARMVKK